MTRAVWILATCVACATSPTDDDATGTDGKDDRGTSRRFVEVNPDHTNLTFRTYIHRALDALETHDEELANLTARSIAAGHVRIDELADLTCADFERVRRDLPDLALTADDYPRLRERGSPVTKAIAEQVDGYMWSNRIYVSRSQEPLRLAATLVHEVNHVINRSEVGYYDNLPTSAFVHEYRAFHAERVIDPDFYEGVNLVEHVLVNYELDRAQVPANVLDQPLTPRLLPDADAWRSRRVADDPADDHITADCM